MAKKAKKPVPQSREEASIKSFLDMIAPSVVSFMPDHFICGNTFRCVWALREYPTSTDEQAILRHLGERMASPSASTPDRSPRLRKSASFRTPQTKTA